MHPAGSVAAARSEVADPRVHRWLGKSWANEGEQGVSAASGPNPVCPFPSTWDRSRTKREQAFQAEAG